MDSTTFFLIIIILVAIVLIAVGIYLILVLHEARITLRRTNRILDHADSIIEILDEKIAKPAGSLLGVLGVVKEVFDMVGDFRGKIRKEPHNGGHESRRE
ncbi:hypothetical protein IH981_00670 [Patescibacteria group bacterium]|nr:hypothetical protein [Patescibacteria group bacterium]